MKKTITTALLLIAVQLAHAQNYNWAFRLGGIGLNESTNSVAADPSGNIYVAGCFEGTVDFNPSATINYPLTSAGGKDIFFAKYTSSGTLIWAYKLGSTGQDEVGAIKINAWNGEVFIAGTFQNTVDFDPGTGVTNLVSAGGYDIFFARYTSAGGLLTARRIGTTTSETFDDMDVNSFSGANGEIVIIGRFSNTVDFDPNVGTVNLSAVGGSEMFVAKYSGTFTYMTAFKMNSNSINGNSVVYADNYSGIYITGGFGGTVDFDPSASTSTLTAVTSTVSDAYIVKYTPAFACSWVKSLGGVGGTKIGQVIKIDGNNDVVVAGMNGGVIDLDPSASVSSFSTNGFYDVFLSKYNSTNGNFIWGNQFGGTGADYVYGLGTDATNNIYISGSYGLKVDFDPVGADTLTSVGTDDVYFAKYNSSGAYQFARSIGNTVSQVSSDLVVTPSDNLYIVGNTNGTNCDFDPSVGTAFISSLGGVDGFVAKYKSCPDPLMPITAASVNNPCSGSAVTFTLAGGFIGGGATWNWYSGSCGGTPVGTGTSIVVSPTVSTSYYVRAEGGCLAGPGVCSSANLISVSPLPTLSVVSNNTILCSGQSATLTASGAFSYSLNTASMPGSTVVISPTVTTTYTITGSTSCYNSITFTQNVTLCTDINEIKNDRSVKIFPNPTSDKIYLSSQQNIEHTEIYDANGKLISKQTGSYQINLSQFNTGIYFLKVYFENNEVTNAKIVKE